jgi:Transcriptional regulators containing a DNA-binding HTH domain and an aminotransferase domain (MocR family) and their eukaryotic orthologs
VITLQFRDKKEVPIYEQLYIHIRKEIEIGNIKGGEKLPSKRKLATHLNVSQNTIENAYAQLIAEGYIETVEKKGYYVNDLEFLYIKGSKENISKKKQENYIEIISDIKGASNKSNIVANMNYTDMYQDIFGETQNSRNYNIIYDLKTNSINTEDFPFSVWAKLMRNSLREESNSLLSPVHPQGDIELRREIALYLRDFKAMNVEPEQIVLGAGTEYLLGLITELLQYGIFAFENPGYKKLAKILKNRKVKMYAIGMDLEGISIKNLKETDANTVLITPAHHFPLGTIMSIKRRNELLNWAASNEKFYIIEDDYDSEFRFVLKPIPTLYSLDKNENVIYLNTFTKTLAPSLRIGYMVLPKKLMENYKKYLGFYSCTVSEFEQHTLKLFMRGRYYERHLNRMRNIYKVRQETFLKSIEKLKPYLQITGTDSGLHLHIKVNNGMSGKDLVESAAREGVKVYSVLDYYFEDDINNVAGVELLQNQILKDKQENAIVLGYGGFTNEELKDIGVRLVFAWLGNL